jgi:hypothetical protein
MYFDGPIQSDDDHLSFIFNAALKLFRLNLPFYFLMRLLENEQMCYLLRQCITVLGILNENQSSQITFSEEHIPIIASTFTRLCELFIDLTHLPPNMRIALGEDVSRKLAIQNFFFKLSQQNSMDSMILSLLTGFKSINSFNFVSLGNLLRI